MSIIATSVKKRVIFKRRQRDELIDFIFSIGSAQVGNHSSKSDSKDFDMYKKPIELKVNLDERVKSSESMELTVHYKATRGFIYLQHILFNPEYVRDCKFKYFAFGWGLFQFIFEPVEDSEIIICTLSYCNHKEMKENKRYFKEFKSPGLWDWKALEEIQNQISGFIDALEWQASR
jgi:hypothetical protein